MTIELLPKFVFRVTMGDGMNTLVKHRKSQK